MRYRYKCDDCGGDDYTCILETETTPDEVLSRCPEGGPANWKLIGEVEE